MSVRTVGCTLQKIQRDTKVWVFWKVQFENTEGVELRNGLIEELNEVTKKLSLFLCSIL